jgi:hypothetical protein
MKIIGFFFAFAGCKIACSVHLQSGFSFYNVESCEPFFAVAGNCGTNTSSQRSQRRAD